MGSHIIKGRKIDKWNRRPDFCFSLMLSYFYGLVYKDSLALLRKNPVITEQERQILFVINANATNTIFEVYNIEEIHVSMPLMR